MIGETYKSRLLLGEGDFSYACALVKKRLATHANFGQAIIATAYESEAELRKKYPNTFDSHIQFLRQHSVTLLYNIDAQELHRHPILGSRKFDCIHFNFPHDGSSYETGRLREILRRFFESAYQMQNLAGRVYMALPKRLNREKEQFMQSVSYNIYENSRHAGYLLAQKRSFDKDRYPGYGHRQTVRAEGAPVAENSREYIFEKTNLTSEEIFERDHLFLRKPIKEKSTGRYVLPEIKTDGTSTDYFFLDLEKPNLFPIPDEERAKQGLSKLFHKRNALFLEIEKGIFDSSKIGELIKKIRSIEVYLCGTSRRIFYTHPSGLDWKNHISTWYYRSVNLPQHTPPKSEDQLELKKRFISFLTDQILKNSNSPKYNPFVVWSLEALFYLFEYNPIRILNEAIKVVNNPEIGYRAKAIALSILMKGIDNPEYGLKKIIPLLIRTIGFDPRLDWMIFFLLGNFDVAAYLLQPEYTEYFNRINDFRLIARMLTKCDFQILFHRKHELPNVYHQNIVTLLHKKSIKHQLNNHDLILEDAIKIPYIYSFCFERDLITWEFSPQHTALCLNVFMPSQSIVENTLLTNLQDRHQEASFMALGRFYLQGTNGCELNHRKALSYFKIPAENGSLEALYQIVNLYSQGLMDISGDDLEGVLQHCDKLKNLAKLDQKQNSIAFVTRGIIMFFKGDLKAANTFFNVTLRMNPDNESALFYKALLEIINGNIQSGQEILKKVKIGFQLFKKCLFLFLQNELDKMQRLSRRASWEEFSLIAVTCGIIAYHQKRFEQALQCFSFVLSQNSTHPTAVAYCQKMNPELNSQENRSGGKYELVFKHFLSNEEYLQEKNKLMLRCSSDRGFFIFIAEGNQTLYLTLSAEIPIKDEPVKVISESIIAACQQNNTDQVQTLMVQLHRFITEKFNVQTKPSLSLQLDDIEKLSIEEVEEVDEEVQQIESQMVERTFPLVKNIDEEQEDPQDID